MKTAELTGVLLDYWVARAEGHERVKIIGAGERLNGVRVEQDTCAATTPGFPDWWQPYHAETWHNAGPIIERELGTFSVERNGNGDLVWYWADMGRTLTRYRLGGKTHLVAAMRAYVASKFGHEVPDEVPA
jgi:hypothetical protein